MAQSALTVTPPNPTYPSNFGSTGATGPNPPNYTKNTYNDPKNWSSVNPKDFPPPFYDDGTAGALTAFATNVAALAGGSGATAGGTEGTYPGTGTGTTVNNVGAVPASTSVAHEGAGTEIVATQTYSASILNPNGPLVTVGVGPALTAGTMPTPNASHASSLSPLTNPTLTTATPSTVSGAGTATVTATGTGFTKQSVIWVNGIPYTTTFVSATSLTAVAPKKATSGTLPVKVVTGGVVETAVQPWTFT